MNRSLNKATKSAENFAAALKGAAVIGALTVAAKRVKDFVLGQIQLADQLKHNAENLGVTTDELQKYQYVASVMQVPTQQAVVAFRFFNRAIGEVALGTKSTTKYFQQMGIQIKDAHGNIKPTDQLLFEFSDKLAGIKDQSLRTAYAMRALGRGGASMLPVLQQGSAALKQMFKDVEELGGGFDEDFIEKAHEVDLESKRLAMGWRTMSALLIKELIPYLKAWIEHGIKNVKMLIDTAKHTMIVGSAIRFVAGVAVAAGAAVAIAWAPQVAIFTALAAAVWYAYLIFDDFYTFLKGGHSVIGDSIDQLGGDHLVVLEKIKKAFEDVKDAFKPLTDAFTGMNGNAASTIGRMVKLAAIIGTTLYGALDTATTAALQLGYALAGITPGSGVSLDDAMSKVKSLGNAWQARAAAIRNVHTALDQLTNPDKPQQAPPTSAPYDAADEAFMKTHPDWKKVNGKWVQHPDVLDLPPPPPPPPLPTAQPGAGLPPPPAPNVTVNVNVAGDANNPQRVGAAAAAGTTKALRNAYSGVTAGMPSAVGNN